MKTIQPQQLRIRTPECVTFSYDLAGPLYRALAWSIDVACIMLLAGAIQGMLAPLQGVSADMATALAIVMVFAGTLAYGVLLEWLWRGQTIGKRVMGLRVQDADGLRLRFSQVLLRNLFRAVDSLPILYLVGVISVLCTRRAQRLGDLAGNTVVIRITKPAHADLERIAPPIYNSLREQPHIAARYRQRVTAREASLALQALLRRDELDDAARVELFSELAQYFRRQVVLPADFLRGVSDEQFVRNLVDVIYRSSGNGVLGKPASNLYR